jgi:hypothetical protein
MEQELKFPLYAHVAHALMFPGPTTAELSVWSGRPEVSAAAAAASLPSVKPEGRLTPHRTPGQ